MDLSDRRILRAAATRLRAGGPERLVADSFPKQRAFILDDSSFVTADCSRRAGKTVGCSGKLLRPIEEAPGAVGLYITLSRLNAKRILWRTLLDMNRAYDFRGEPNESELCLRFASGYTIYLAGANDRSEIEKFRGLPVKRAILDEVQSFPPYVRELVDEVLAPSLMDYGGGIDLVGTPPPVPVGYFFDACHSEEWAHHAWTVFDNPHILRKSGKTPQQHLDAELKRRGIDANDPVIQREWFGRFATDKGSLVFAYDAARNHFRDLPTSKSPWQYVIGGDLGFDDADALAVLAWSDDHPAVWLVEEWAGSKQTITQLGDRLRALYAKYEPMAVVVDTGGLGKKIAVEIAGRTGIPIEAADKQRKLEHIELLNDALRSSRFFARRTDRFAHDAMLVEWDRTNPEKPEISERFHSDICDAALYAYRRCLHWLKDPTQVPAPAMDTEQWRRIEEERLVRAAEDRLLASQSDAGAESGGVGNSEDWESIYQ